MTGIILGVLFILGGCVAGFMTLYAASMAARPVTAWEGLRLPALCFFVPVLIGVSLIVWR